jgi:spoIIIJ-associated protein
MEAGQSGTHPANAGEAARDFVSEVVAAMGMEADVELDQTEDGTWRVDVTGNEAGDLIGRYGDTINALQYLTTLVALRRSGEHARLLLDADGYRDRRQAALTELARSLAADVKASGQEAELDPLSAFERRIIHNSLLDHPDVITYSEGDEPDRRVIIAPRPQRGEEVKG